MPTGYTEDVQSGKITEFRDFAMQCARAFGALITLRDEPSGTPIPDEFKPAAHYHERLAEAQAELYRLRAMTPEQAAFAAKAQYAEDMAWRQKRNKERREQRARYAIMLEQAKTWEPPTNKHAALKEFMVQQLEESIKFDCGELGPESEPPQFSGEAWHARALARATKDVENATQYLANEEKRCAERTEWVRALRASLPA